MIAKKFSVTNHIVGVSAIVLCTIVGCLNAGWCRTYGGKYNEGGNFATQTSDGGYIITGYSSNEDAIWVVRTDDCGDTTWTRMYDEGYLNEGRCVRETEDFGYLVTGHSALKLLLIRYDSEGDTLWTKVHGEEYAVCNWMEKTSNDGGYVLAGNLDENGRCLIKIDSLGYFLWTGSTSLIYTYGYCVKETKDSGYIVAGHYYDYDPGLPFDKEGPFLAKFDANGVREWENTYHVYEVERGSDASYLAYGVCETVDGGFIAIGSRWESHFGFKTDSYGNELWWKEYGDGICTCIEEAVNGGYVISGILTGNPRKIYMRKIDEDGEEIWVRTWNNGASTFRNSVQNTNDKGYILTGGVYSGKPSYDVDFWLCKTDSLGNLAVEEQPIIDQPDRQIHTPIGRTITLRAPDGSSPLDLAVFDASGRMVDELILDGSGAITWGECYGPGVYFIRESSGRTPLTCKVILVK